MEPQGSIFLCANLARPDGYEPPSLPLTGAFYLKSTGVDLVEADGFEPPTNI